MGIAVSVRVACPADRRDVIQLINRVAGEHCHLQTDRYCPTPAWEQLLRTGLDSGAGLLLLVAEVRQAIAGFARLTPDWEYTGNRAVGNVGIALLPPYRSQRIGSRLLMELIAWAPYLGFRMLNAAILAANYHSQSLFRKYGFGIVRIRERSLSFREHSAWEYLVGLSLVQREMTWYTPSENRS